MNPVVTASSIRKQWAAGSGLNPVSFALEPAVMTVVRGRSGSGKSTLLSILAGWTDPDGGALLWSSRLDQRRRRTWSGIAIAGQVLAPIKELTIIENVALPLESLVDKSGARRRAAHLLTELDVGDEIHRTPEEVSLGQLQRMTIARALVAESDLVLIDEPTSHQDRSHAVTVVDVLRRHADRGGAVLVATHDPHVIERADRVVALSGESPDHGPLHSPGLHAH